MAGGNGNWRAIALLLAGGGLGAGTGSLTGAIAQEDAVRTLVARSPEIAIIKTIQAEIRADVETLRVEQRATGDDVASIERKVDRLLFILEQDVED